MFFPYSHYVRYIFLIRPNLSFIIICLLILTHDEVYPFSHFQDRVLHYKFISEFIPSLWHREILSSQGPSPELFTFRYPVLPRTLQGVPPKECTSSHSDPSLRPPLRLSTREWSRSTKTLHNRLRSQTLNQLTVLYGLKRLVMVSRHHLILTQSRSMFELSSLFLCRRHLLNIVLILVSLFYLSSNLHRLSSEYHYLVETSN